MSGGTLSPAARALVHAGRSLYVPSAADTARVHGRLAAKIAAPMTAAATVKIALSGIVGKVTVVTLFAAIVGVVGVRSVSSHARSVAPRPTNHVEAAPRFQPRALAEQAPRAGIVTPLGLRESPDPSRAPAPVALLHSISSRGPAPASRSNTTIPVQPTLAAAAIPVVEPAAVAAPIEPVELPAIGIHLEEPVIATVGDAQSRTEAPTRRAWTFFDEQQFLQSARIQMALGHPAQALALLDEQGVRFPNGVLRVARHAVRALVLCMVGRTPEARTEAEAVLRRESVGPHADMVRGSCAGDANR